MDFEAMLMIPWDGLDLNRTGSWSSFVGTTEANLVRLNIILAR